MKKHLRLFNLSVLFITASVGISQPSWPAEICLVTVDSSTATYINVIWTKPIATDIDSFYIYRADTAGAGFQKIAAVGYLDSSAYDDIAVNVNTTAYSYKISAVDLGGIEGGQSAIATTALLNVTAMGGYDSCSWTSYSGSNSPSQLRCMWDSLGTGGPMTQVGSMMPWSWTSWNHHSQSAMPNSMYRLEIFLNNSCSPSRAIVNTSRSNIKNVVNPTLNIKTSEEVAKLVKAFPNPSEGIFVLEWNASLQVNKIELLDVAGRTIQSFNPANNQLKKIIDLTANAEGIYFVNFHSGKGVLSKRLVCSK